MQRIVDDLLPWMNFLSLLISFKSADSTEPMIMSSCIGNHVTHLYILGTMGRDVSFYWLWENDEESVSKSVGKQEALYVDKWDISIVLILSPML